MCEEGGPTSTQEKIVIILYYLIIEQLSKKSLHMPRLLTLGRKIKVL
jgi:hypothetical protein